MRADNRLVFEEADETGNQVCVVCCGQAAGNITLELGNVRLLVSSDKPLDVFWRSMFCDDAKDNAPYLTRNSQQIRGSMVDAQTFFDDRLVVAIGKQPYNSGAKFGV